VGSLLKYPLRSLRAFECYGLVFCIPLCIVKEIIAYSLNICYCADKWQLSNEAREFFVNEGGKGGKIAARKMTKEQRREKMRRAAQARWAKQKKEKST
jgi:hypothetical protein